MDAARKNALIALLANVLAEHLTEDQLLQAASIFTQLGTSLGFIASQKALDAVSENQSERQNTTPDSPSPPCSPGTGKR